MNLRIGALLTCHNRRDYTLSCLRALTNQQVDEVTIAPVVVDAASTDGTPEAVADEFPHATLVRGSADLYWNRGMHVAFIEATREDLDAFLWLNDDTVLDDEAVAMLLKTRRSLARKTEKPAIVVGSTRDPISGEPTYGGVYRPAPRTRPLRFALVKPSLEPRECETMNGNCVLIPREITERVGILDPAFTHGMGDFDYGLRARRSGFSVWIAPGTVGTCARNKPSPRRDLRTDTRALAGPKGLPPREWARFARRWAGPLWPVYAASPYVRWTARRLCR